MHSCITLTLYKTRVTTVEENASFFYLKRATTHQQREINNTSKPRVIKSTQNALFCHSYTLYASHDRGKKGISLLLEKGHHTPAKRKPVKKQ